MPLIIVNQGFLWENGTQTSIANTKKVCFLSPSHSRVFGAPEQNNASIFLSTTV